MWASPKADGPSIALLATKGASVGGFLLAQEQHMYPVWRGLSYGRFRFKSYLYNCVGVLGASMNLKQAAAIGLGLDSI